MSLADYITAWHPEPTTVTDPLEPRQAQDLAATLDCADTFAVGDALPLLWQWVYFLDWPPTAALGADGHPADGHFLPPIPDRRRMFAGGRITVTAPLVLGEAAQRHSAVVSTAAKDGRSGEMLFVTVRHEYRQDGTLRITEEQDLVYRSESSTPTRQVRPAPAAPAPDVPTALWSAAPNPTPPLLFRFSALTANSHRIHYDHTYTTEVEGFPALVVHGPLLAIYLAELVRSSAPASPASAFEFRLSRPIFLGDSFHVQGTPQTDGADLAVIGPSGAAHATATARLD